MRRSSSCRMDRWLRPDTESALAGRGPSRAEGPIEGGGPWAADTPGDRPAASRRLGRKTALWSVAGACGAAAILVLLYPRRPPVADEPIEGRGLSTGVRLSLTSDVHHLPGRSSSRLRRLQAPTALLRLWVRNLDASDARPLPGTEVALGGIVPPMFWSPDSRFVAFDASGQLKKIDVTGGPPQTVCTLPELAVGGSWNQEGVIVVGSPQGGISRCPASGGSASIVTNPDPSQQQSAHLLPWFLPDGRRFLYLSRVQGRAREFRHLRAHARRAAGTAASTRILDARFGAAYVPDGDGANGAIYCSFATASSSHKASIRQVCRLTGAAARVAEPVGSLSGRRLLLGFDETARWSSDHPRGRSRLTWLDRQGNVLGHVGEPGRYSGLALAPERDSEPWWSSTRSAPTSIRTSGSSTSPRDDRPGSRSMRGSRTSRCGPQMASALSSPPPGRSARSSTSPSLADKTHACYWIARSTRVPDEHFSRTDDFCCIPT